MEARYLFLFELLVRLNAIKNSFVGNTLPLVLLLSPSVVCSFSQWYCCVFVSVLFILLAWGVILSLCLFVQFVSPFIPSLRPSLSFLFKDLAWNRDRRAPAVFLTHSSFLKSKPTEAKSGYYLSCVSSLPLSPVLPFLLKVYEILHFEKKQGAVGQSEERV